MKTPFLSFLCLFMLICEALAGNTQNSITNVIAKALENVNYSIQGKTEENRTTCIKYAYKINEIAKKDNKETEIWETSGKQVIIIIKDGNQRICYCSGKIVNEGEYSKTIKIHFP